MDDRHVLNLRQNTVLCSRLSSRRFLTNPNKEWELLIEEKSKYTFVMLLKYGTIKLNNNLYVEGIYIKLIDFNEFN